MADNHLDENVGALIGEMNQVQTKFTWVIGKFEEKVFTYTKIFSPIFITLVDDLQTNWQLNMTFHRRDKDDEENISIFINCLNSVSFRLSVEFSILDIDNKEDIKYGLYDKIIKTKPWGIEHFIKKDKLLNKDKSKLLSEGKLTIICNITSNQYVDVENHINDVEYEKILVIDGAKHLLKLFLSGNFSNVVISVEGKEIHAHKSILANRSSVFRAMFTHEMEETRTNSVVVEDISHSTMLDLLIFIYSSTITAYSKHEQHKNYLDLMIAANKYDINNLKVECERRLSKNLKIDNVFESLASADKYNALLLKKKAIDFIISNVDQIVESSAFKEFGNLHPELCCEVFRGLVIKRRKID